MKESEEMTLLTQDEDGYQQKSITLKRNIKYHFNIETGLGYTLYLNEGNIPVFVHDGIRKEWVIFNKEYFNGICNGNLPNNYTYDTYDNYKKEWIEGRKNKLNSRVKTSTSYSRKEGSKIIL